MDGLVEGPVQRDGRLGIRFVQPSPLDLWATKPVIEEATRERCRTLIVLTRVPARARLTNDVLAELSRLHCPIAACRLGNRTAYAATLAVGASVADWAMQDEPWCIDAAREIRLLAQEIFDCVAPHSQFATRELVSLQA